MKIFVAYSFHENDRWIEDYVFPLIESFDAEVLEGKELQGQVVDQGVRARLKEADGCLGFRTLRDPKLVQGQDGSGSHQWVTQELGWAINDLPLLAEVREVTVKETAPQQGRQPISFDPQRREQCLIEIATLLKTWRQLQPLKVRLLPQALIDAVRSAQRNGEVVKCVYRHRDGHRRSQSLPADIVLENGLFIFVEKIPPRALVEVEIQIGAKLWKSDWEGIQLPSVFLT